MRFRALSWILLASATLFVPGGLAEHVEPTCSVPTSSSPRAGDFYVRVIDVGGAYVIQVWQETNHIAGLQARDHRCPDGTLYLRDTLVYSCDTSRPTSAACIFIT